MDKPIKKPKHTSGEKFVLTFLLLFLFSNLAFLFYTVSTGYFKGEDVNEYAEQTTKLTEPIYAERGKIYDVNGEVVATNTTTYDLVAILDPTAPNHVTNPEEVAQVLSKTCKNTSEQEIMHYLNKDDLYQTELGSGCKNLSIVDMEYLYEHPVEGIEVIEKPNRYYPNPYFASPIIGYAKPNEEGTIEGEIGMEAILNEELSGTNGTITYPVDQYGNKLPGAEQIVPAQNGCDVYLTIDARIQNILESSVEDAWNKFDPKHIMAIVMDPDTGDILAATARPTFNLNDRHDIITYLNPLVEMTYEPGSVMKAFLWGTAMSMGVYDGDATYMSGSRTFEDGTVVKDWNKTGWGEITYDQGLIRSSNTAAIDIASQMVGYDNYYEQLLKLGFSEPVSIYGMTESLPGSINYDYETEKANVAFGQGIQVTAVQVAQAFTAIASQTGDVYQLNVVDQVVCPDSGEVIYESEPQVVSEDVYTPEATNELLELMQQVVEDPNGSAHDKIGNIPGYDVSVKTGTAQEVVNGEYTHSNSGYLYSALIAAPTSNPEVAMYVVVDQPQDLSSLGWASGTPIVGMIANPVLANALTILGVEPDNPEELYNQSKEDMQPIETPSFINMPVSTATKKLEAQNRQYIVIGDGDTVINQTPAAFSTLYYSDVVVLITNGEATVPDFTGISQRDLERICSTLGIKPNISGSGYVKTQSVPAGTPITKDMEIKFTLG